jgi:hypothetical protein
MRLHVSPWSLDIKNPRKFRHFLDWANQPLSFKIYPKLDLIPVPRELRETGVPALSTIAQVSRRDNALPDLQKSDN